MDAETKKMFNAMLEDKRQAEERHEAAEERHQAAAKLMQDQLIALTALVQGQQGRVSTHKDLSSRMVSFTYDADTEQTFENWFNRYQTIFTTDAAHLAAPAKVALLTEKLSSVDYHEFACAILPLTIADIPFADAVARLKMIFGRKTSKFTQRYKCLNLTKSSSEDFTQLAARINASCTKFDLNDFTADDLKVLVFVKAINSPSDASTLEKLLSKLDQQEMERENAIDNQARDALPKLKLDDVVNIATRLSNLKVEKSMVLHPESVQSYAIHDKRQSFKKPRSPQGQSTAIRPCWKCGETSHNQRFCPFSSNVCSFCNKPGHKSDKKICDANSAWQTNPLQYHQQRQSQSSPINSWRSNAVHSTSRSTRKFVEPVIDNTRLRLQLDSGSDWTIISEAHWVKAGSPELSPCSESAISASGDRLVMLGTFNAKVMLSDRSATGKIYVAGSDLNVLGSDWMEKLSLWTVPIASICNHIAAPDSISFLDQVVRKFPKLFDQSKLGLCNRFKASLTLKESAQPVFRKARPPAFAATPLIENELNRLQMMGVIEPTHQSSFAAPIVVVKRKDGRVRLCADYSTGLNDSLEPHQYPLPTPEAIFAKLAGFTIFSLIDFSDAFLQIELDDDAKKLATINTHIGMFQMNRLQFGLKTAPGIFQQEMDKMMNGAEGVFTYIDDILVGGRDEKDHEKNLFEVLRRIESHGFRLKPEKCSFGQSSLKYLGHIIDKDGIKPSRDFDIRYIDNASFAYADFISRLIANHERDDDDTVIACVDAGVDEKNTLVPSIPSEMTIVKENHTNNSQVHASGSAMQSQLQKIISKTNGPNVKISSVGIRSALPDDGSINTILRDDSIAGCFAIDSVKSLPITFEALQAETTNDAVLTAVIGFIAKGWPEKSKSIEVKEVRSFHQHRKELICIKGVVFFGDRAVIPTRFRSEILRELHEGHPGTTRMSDLATSKVFWPGISEDIKRHVQRCTPPRSLALKSPFEIMTERPMKTKLDLLQPPKALDDHRDAKMERQFDSHHSARFKEFDIGDDVFVQRCAYNKWYWTEGVVMSRKGKVDYVVRADSQSGVRDSQFHANQMKRRYTLIDDDNPLLKEFELQPADPSHVKAEIEPDPDPKEAESDAPDEDAEPDVADDEEAEAVQEAPSAPSSINYSLTPRRSQRTNAGVPFQSIYRHNYGYK